MRITGAGYGAGARDGDGAGGLGGFDPGTQAGAGLGIMQPVCCLAEPERTLGTEAEAGLDGECDTGRERQIGVVGAAGARGDLAED